MALFISGRSGVAGTSGGFVFGDIDICCAEKLGPEGLHSSSGPMIMKREPLADNSATTSHSSTCDPSSSSTTVQRSAEVAPARSL